MKQENLDRVMKITNQVINEDSSDISQFPTLLSDIIYRVYSNSLVGEIADVQPLKTPIGKIGTLYATYTGDESATDSSAITVLKISDVTGYDVGSIISTAAASGKILYIENDGDILVEITSGIFAVNDVTIENTATISSVISNRNYASRVFSDYSLATERSVPKSISFELKFNDIEVKSRKLKSIFSSESIEDLRKMYGIDVANEMIVKEFAAEIIQEIDMEIIDYLRKIATPSSDLVLANSYGINGDIMAVGNDIYANIYKNAMKISKDTKRKQNFFVLADSNTMALLMTNPLHISPESDKKNSYYMGKLGTQYSLYLDPFSTEQYVVVGYTDDKNGTGDSGLIYAPYTNTIIEAQDQDKGNNIFFNFVRYGYTNHPQDTGTGVADSIFFRTFNINGSYLNNFVIE